MIGGTRGEHGVLLTTDHAVGVRGSPTNDRTDGISNPHSTGPAYTLRAVLDTIIE